MNWKAKSKPYPSYVGSCSSKFHLKVENCSGRFSLHFWLFLPCSSAAAVKTVGPFVAIWLKPPHLNHTALITGHLETASDALPIFWSQLKSIVPPSRPAFSKPHPRITPKMDPPVRARSQKLHVISKLHYKDHSTESKQLVRCGFSDPTIFSSCRNNARISV